jgi:hypothetical protein
MRTARNHGYIESVGREQAEKSGIVLWILIAIYAAARVLQISPGRAPMLAVVALHVFPPAVFALIHGAKLYQWRGSVMFVAL